MLGPTEPCGLAEESTGLLAALAKPPTSRHPASGRGVIMGQKGRIAAQTPINRHLRCPVAPFMRKKPRKYKLLTLFRVVIAHRTTGEFRLTLAHFRLSFRLTLTHFGSVSAHFGSLFAYCSPARQVGPGFPGKHARDSSLFLSDLQIGSATRRDRQQSPRNDTNENQKRTTFSTKDGIPKRPPSFATDP